MIQRTTIGSTVPAAFVTKSRQRVKQYNNDSVYLNNGSEFELELFNPTTSKVMAKIQLNGISIGAGIVLHPGERVFIERYLDVARKFMYKTYEVDGSNDDVKRAIANNGDVKVLFYKEVIPYSYTTTTWTTPWPTWGTCTYTDKFGDNFDGNFSGTLRGMGDMRCNSSGNTACMDGMDGMNSCFTSQSMDFAPETLGRKLGKMKSSGSLKSKKISKSLETGRIDKGSVSNQSFGHDHSTFETYWTWSTEWKILPESQKPVVTEDLKIFCTNCGSRKKKRSNKYCPNCGTQY